MRVLHNEDFAFVVGGEREGDFPEIDGASVSFGFSANGGDYGVIAGYLDANLQASLGCELIGAAVGGVVGQRFGGTVGGLAGVLAMAMCERLTSGATTVADYDAMGDFSYM